MVRPARTNTIDVTRTAWIIPLSGRMATAKPEFIPKSRVIPRRDWIGPEKSRFRLRPGGPGGVVTADPFCVQHKLGGRDGRSHRPLSANIDTGICRRLPIVSRDLRRFHAISSSVLEDGGVGLCSRRGLWGRAAD